jgi:hypothetical protein
MAVTKVLARGWKVEVETTTPGTYIEVKGLTQLEFGDDPTRSDTTDFNSQGAAEHIVAERSHTLSIEGRYLEDPDTGDRDPGQERVEEIGRAVGSSSLGNFRLTSPGGNIATFQASASISKGGSTNDPTNWQAELQVSGPITYT